MLIGRPTIGPFGLLAVRTAVPMRDYDPDDAEQLLEGLLSDNRIRHWVRAGEYLWDLHGAGKLSPSIRNGVHSMGADVKRVIRLYEVYRDCPEGLAGTGGAAVISTPTDAMETLDSNRVTPAEASPHQQGGGGLKFKIWRLDEAGETVSPVVYELDELPPALTESLLSVALNDEVRNFFVIGALADRLRQTVGDGALDPYRTHETLGGNELTALIGDYRALRGYAPFWEIAQSLTWADLEECAPEPIDYVHPPSWASNGPGPSDPEL